MARIEDIQPYRGEVRALVFEGDVEPMSVLSDTGNEAWRRLVSEYVSSNLVTDIGRQQMTKLIVGETTALCLYMALSTSVVAVALSDTVASIPDRISTVALTVHQSFSNFYQRYVGYFSTVSFATTGINTEALLDASSTAAATNLWADAAVTLSKSATQSLVVDHRIQATTG
jgi:hypothetical protein